MTFDAENDTWLTNEFGVVPWYTPGRHMSEAVPASIVILRCRLDGQRTGAVRIFHTTADAQ